MADEPPPTRRRQSRMKSLLSVAECADELPLVVLDTPSVPPHRLGPKRRTKSDSAVFTVGDDIALTPKGRIRKALKGQKVHKCQCGKIYTRNEHLKRHQATHGEPSTTCDHPGCKKEFYRDDLYCRHRRAHEQPDETSPIVPTQSILTPLAGPSGPGQRSLETVPQHILPVFDGLDLLADTAAMYGVSDPVVNSSTGFLSLHHNSSLPEVDPIDLLDPNLWAGPATSYPWIPPDEFIDPALTMESADASSSEYSYGSVMHPSPAPRHATYSRFPFEYSQSVPPTPAPMSSQTDWNRDNLLRFLTLADPDLSGASSSMHLTSGPGWYPTPMTTGPQSACMSRTDSATVVAGNYVMQPDILEDFTPFMDGTLGPGASGHDESSQPQRGPRWR